MENKDDCNITGDDQAEFIIGLTTRTILEDNKKERESEINIEEVEPEKELISVEETPLEERKEEDEGEDVQALDDNQSDANASSHSSKPVII